MSPHGPSPAASLPPSERGNPLSRSRRARTVLLVALALSALAVVAGRAVDGNPSGRSGAALRYIATMRPGGWVQLEGDLRGPRSVSCTEVGQLAGDFLDDDWSLRGTVRAVDRARREFAIGGCRVRVDEDTFYDNPKGTFRGFADVRDGILVEVDGTFLQSGVLLAAEVDDESEELTEQPKLSGRLAAVGRIERIDSRKRIVTVMGIEFQLTDKTRLRSVID